MQFLSNRKARGFGVTAFAALFSVFGAQSAFAGPTGTITIDNNMTVDAEVRSRTSCVGSINPSFTDVTDGTTETSDVVASFDSIFSCDIEYRKAGSFSDCRFVVSRLTSFSLGVFRWNYPQVVVYEDSGVNCSYTFTSVSDTGAIPNGTNGNFSVTLTIDD